MAPISPAVGARAHRCKAANFCSQACQRKAWSYRKEDCRRSSLAAGGCRESSLPTVDTSRGPYQDSLNDDWIQLVNVDAFPGQDVAAVKESDVGSQVLRQRCLDLGCGGYVSWRGVAYLRQQKAAELHDNIEVSQGTMLSLPASHLSAVAAARLSSSGLALPAYLPEVVFEGARPVEKCSDQTEEEMTERFLQSKPVVLTDAQDGWAARSKWTFDWLAEHFGDEEMLCSDLAPFFKHVDRNVIQTAKVPMREFARYVRGRPSGLRALQKSPERPFYANGWTPFHRHTELLNDVSDRLYCVQDTVPRLPGSKGEFCSSLTKVFLGPAGTVSRLHHDTYATHVWLSQIRGRKQFICFPPEDARHLHCLEEDECDGKTSLFDPSAPDFGKFPNVRQAHAFSVVVEEGETVVLPSRWFHWAKSLTPSITLMRNFVNDTNVQEYFRIVKATEAARARKQRAAEDDALADQPSPPSPGGVRVEVLRPGDGKTYPQRGQTLGMHYTGTLAATGKKFDSSRDRGKPLQFRLGVGQVIRGWDEGVPRMSLGEVARLHVRSDYAYGSRGAGDAVPPGADLVFEVELLSIS